MYLDTLKAPFMYIPFRFLRTVPRLRLLLPSFERFTIRCRSVSFGVTASAAGHSCVYCEDEQIGVGSSIWGLRRVTVHDDG